MELEATELDVSQNDGQAVITVLRGAGTTGTVTVDYSTSDGTATGGTDYSPVSGTLTFADGEYLKTITIPILIPNYGRAGNTETFTLNLSDPTGGAELYADEKSATVNIANIYTVNTYTVTNTNNSGPGSLRQAIIDSNRFSGDGSINFDIGGGGVQTIKPVTTLPTITEAVTIDGTTQPGYAGTPIIELDGEQAPGASGIVIFAPNVTVRGLVINRFQGAGILDPGYLGGSVPSNYPAIFYDTIVGNYIGTDVTGLVAEPNGTGMLLGGIGGGYFQVGGTTAADRNVISGNSGRWNHTSRWGPRTASRATTSASAPTAQRRWVTAAIGVDVTNADYLSYHAQDVHIGGPDADQGNIIAYNKYGVVNNEADLLGPVISSSTSVLSNSIYSNRVLGISLDNNNNFFNTVLASGSDRQPQNYPVLNSAVSSGGQTTITGYLNSAADQSFTIQLFSNAGVPFTNFAQARSTWARPP